jgi:hypothetical protein
MVGRGCLEQVLRVYVQHDNRCRPTGRWGCNHRQSRPPGRPSAATMTAALGTDATCSADSSTSTAQLHERAYVPLYAAPRVMSYARHLFSPCSPRWRNTGGTHRERFHAPAVRGVPGDRRPARAVPPPGPEIVTEPLPATIWASGCRLRCWPSLPPRAGADDYRLCQQSDPEPVRPFLTTSQPVMGASSHACLSRDADSLSAPDLPAVSFDTARAG